MLIKDYYGVLEVPASATITDIKKAYRRLALLYHPDTNNNDPYAAARFTEIKEAYEVLTHPNRREIYHQQRWFAQSQGQKKKQQIITPSNVLKQVIELERYVSKLDTFRMDKEGLAHYIDTMLDDNTIEKLNMFNELDVIDRIVERALVCLKLLPLQQVIPLHLRLTKLNTNEHTNQILSLFLQKRKNANQRDRFRIWVIVIIVIVLCLLILFLAE